MYGYFSKISKRTSIVGHPEGPLCTMKKVDEVEVPKALDKLMEEEQRQIEVNIKAINYLLCVVNADEFKKLLRCQNAKEMWEKLNITHEGTNKVCKTRTDNLKEDFDNFKMKDDEITEEMFDELGKITLELDLMRVVNDHEKIICKVLKNLTGQWKIKAIAIEESGKTVSMTNDEERGQLMAYESTTLRKETKEINLRKEKGVALRINSTKEEPSFQE